MTKASGLTAIIVTVALALTALSVAVASNGGPDPAAVEGDSVGRLAPDLPRLIAAFRREQQPSDQVPGDPAAAIEPGDRQPGESPDLARAVGVANGSRIYLWPARESVCLSHAWFGGCVPTAVLADKGAVVGTTFLAPGVVTSAPVHRAVVLARDGVEEVRVLTRTGLRVVADTSDNATVVDLPAEVLSAEWSNVDGSRATQYLGDSGAR